MKGTPVKSSGDSATLSAVRIFLLAILLFGTLGILVDLFLLEHTEGFWQQAPLYLLVAGLAALAWHAVNRGSASVRLLQATMILFVLSGAIGMLLHYKGNVEFELEMHAAAKGLNLFREAMMGATPALAPGVMMQLGLLGLAYTFRHPALTAPTKNGSQHLEK